MMIEGKPQSGTSNPTPAKSSDIVLPLLAWVGMFIISSLPDLFFQYLTGQIPPWIDQAKLAGSALFLGIVLVWRTVRPLWQYALVLLVFFLSYVTTQWIYQTPWWQARFAGEDVSFFAGFLGLYILDSVIALAVIAALLAMKRHRQDFFLTRGQLDAPIKPVRWLGIREGESWRTFGWIFAVVASLLVAIPTLLVMRPSTGALTQALPLLPAALLFAAINAFNEEIYFRASLLSTLPDVIGRNQAMLITITLFGLAHFLYGSPPGMVGFLMTGFLAFLLGKSMLETRGFTWPWFIHFLPDAVIFFSYAVVFVQ
jgi:membrane protease YdiL (CAAX protease family)